MSLKRPGHSQTKADRGCDGAPCRANRCRLPALPETLRESGERHPKKRHPKMHQGCTKGLIAPFKAVKPSKPVKLLTLSAL